MDDFRIESIDDSGRSAQQAPGRDLGGGGFGAGQSRIDRVVDFAKKNFKLVIAIVAILMLALILMFGRTGFSLGNVVVEIEAEDSISSGDIVTYKVIYTNKNNIGLSNARLSFIYPEDSMPIGENGFLSVNNVVLDIGHIGKNSRGEQTFKAMIIGDRGDIKTARAVLRFRPDNLRSEFMQENTFETEITRLAVPIDLVAPPSMISGESVTYIIDYRNGTQDTLQNMRLVVEYPEGFGATSVRPNPDSIDYSAGTKAVWDIGVLRPGEGERIRITGIMRGNIREAKDIIAHFQHLVEAGGTGAPQYIDFELAKSSSVISSKPLSAEIKVNQSRDYVAHLGDMLNYEVNFTNSSEVTLSGVVLKAGLDGRMFDVSTVATDGFFDSRTNTITWDASSIPSLGVLRPNESGTAKFRVRLKRAFIGTGLDTQDSLVKVDALIETKNVPSELGLVRLYGDDQLITRISSQPSFQQAVLRRDSQWGSQGPYPPQVDKETAFTVVWTLINPINKVSPARVTAVLEPGVNWTGNARSSGGAPEPRFDSQTRMVIWDIGSLPGGLGGAFPAYEARFQVSIMPSLNQIGSTVPLIKNTAFNGADAFTKEQIMLYIKDASTKAIDDEKESGVVGK